MKIKYNNYQSIADISVSGLFTALIIAVNLILKTIIGFDVGVYLILICTIFFKPGISFGIAIASSFMSIFVNSDVFYTIAVLLSTLIFWLFCTKFKIVLYRYFIFAYLILMIFSVLKYGIIYGLWYVTSDKQTALSMYIFYTLEMHFTLIGYMLLPIFITKRIFKMFKGIKNMNESYFNNKILQELRGELIMNTFSNEKKHYQIQKASLLISMMVMISFVCYVPYVAAVWFLNYKFAALIFITPLVMKFITPLWLKRKNKIGNKKQLETNWIGILLGIILTLIPTCFQLSQYSKVLQIHFIVLFVLGLIVFSVFIAGAIPMNIEIIKSYNLRNNNVEKIKTTMGFTCFLLVPFPIIFHILNLNYLSIVVLAVATFVVIVLLMSNKNILDKPNVLDVDKGNFKFIKQNKHYLTIMFMQSYLYGISKFFEFGAMLLLFMPLFKDGLVVDANSWTYGAMICAIYLTKYILQAIFRTINCSETNGAKLNVISSLLIVLGVGMLLGFWISTKFISQLFVDMDLTNWSYFGTLLIASALISAGATIMDKTKPSMYKKLLIKNTLEKQCC
ncbi:hypothetical protein SCLARK_001709 [Spiroplasma clarkii]|uniref:hypothetical protein n=1 Tax=Spiroplasma clarkii TaxID=2139 RepID=UPI000B552A24|nr:hypothetical protein [Spiroplasma clarkii]ARU92167.1 hypothetical protein SCLARK_001709 [Spiroplasma clarkii]